MSLRGVSPLTHRPDSAFAQAVAGVARRAVAGEPFLPAVRELIEEFSLLQMTVPGPRRAPVPTGDARHDAFLGALAEHLAAAAGIEPAAGRATATVSSTGLVRQHGAELPCRRSQTPAASPRRA